jgi:hypothetical protein
LRRGRSQKKRTVILELDRQGTVSLLWNKRRVENLKPDGMLKSVDSFTPQPEVRRAESVMLEQTIAELRGAGVRLIVLDLPGTHSPAINKAIGIADITLIPTRPRDARRRREVFCDSSLADDYADDCKRAFYLSDCAD